ncbi:MAG: hypothetical protein Tsb0014_02580 [Pleurocapsa sp.]
MKSCYYLSLLSILTISLASCSTPKSPTEIANQLDKSLVLISYQDKAGHGTGFFVPVDSERCKVLTARHVVAEQEIVILKTEDGKTREVDNILPFENQDLALLTFAPEDGKCPYQALELGDSDTVKKRQSVVICGFYNNGGRSFDPCVDGGVNIIDNLPEGYGIAYKAGTTQGMSGSPVVNSAGEVIAVHGRIDVEKIARLSEEIIIDTFEWGIPINLYLANAPKIEVATLSTLSAEDYFNQGNNLRVSGKYDDAIASYEKALKLDPDYAHAWKNRGISLAILERHSEAIASYDKAIELDPDDALAWIGRGISLEILERYNEALTSYDKAIELDPNDAFAWYNRGISLEILERYNEALTSYDKAIELDPDDSNAWYNRGNSLAKLERYSEALAFYDKALELNPNDASAWDNRGDSLAKLERYSEAITSYDRAIELDPDYARTWYNKGFSLAELERYDDAIASYDKAIELDPDYALAIENRRLLLEKMNQ